MTQVAQVAVNVTANASQFMTAMAAAGNSAASLRDQLGNCMGKFAAFGAAANAVGLGIAGALVHSSMEAVDQQAKLARAVGASTGGFQSLAYAADLAGVNQEELAKASGKLNNKLGEAILRGGQSAEVFQRLGLNVRDLANMDADQRMATIADQIQKMGLDSTAAGNALKEMGMKSEEMRQFMMDGGDQIRQASAELEGFGVKLDNIESNKIEAANDAISRLSLISKGAGNQIAVALSPYIEVMAKRLGDASKESHGFKTQIESAIKTGMDWIGKLADALHYANMAWKGMQVAVAFVAESIVTVFGEAMLTVAKSMDGWVMLINLAMKTSNELLGTQYKFLDLPSESKFMHGVELGARAAQNTTKRLHDELIAMANEPLPSTGVKKFLDEVTAEANNNAAKTNNDRSGATQLESTQADPAAAKHDKEVASIMGGLQAGTTAMQVELAKRHEILAIYRANQVSANATQYEQELAQIAITEQTKQADILAKSQQDAAKREEQKAANLARVGEDRLAMAAIIAQYDQQDVLAEQLKQEQITQAQADAQRAREKLRNAEREHAISTVMGLGEQLMGAMQGHGKAGFEMAKKIAIASATVSGIHSAVDAWGQGMKFGGPYAMPLAAAMAASSLLKTGSMIKSIASQHYNSGSAGASVSAGGGGGVSMPSGGGGAPAAASGSPSVMNIQGIDPTHLINGSMLESIVKGVNNFVKDGGTVHWVGK